MNSFEYKVIEQTPITHGMLRIIRQISEFRGKQELFKSQSPQVLETLRQVAVIQSTECSNRIEGVTAPLARIKDLVAHKTAPQNRSEQEIAGYRDVLNTIHANAAAMRFSRNLVLQLHRDLYQFLPGEGGHWKPVDNEITETGPDGSKVVRFVPVPAYKTADCMERLHTGFDQLVQVGEIDTLPEVELPAEAAPVIYMPGVSRQTLRAVHECPEELKPLVAMQYRDMDFFKLKIMAVHQAKDALLG